MGMMQIPPFKYYFPKTTVNWIVANIQRLLEEGEHLTLGKYTEQFERKFAIYTGKKHAVGMVSGTAAKSTISATIL